MNRWASTATARYSRAQIRLPDGRSITGNIPGRALPGSLNAEQRLSEQLAILLEGITEAVLPYGRADVLTSEAVFEVEPFKSWREGVRQVLAYAAQTELPPHLALFGAASAEQVQDVYLRLRDGRPSIVLWCWDGVTAARLDCGWVRLTSSRSCRAIP